MKDFMTEALKRISNPHISYVYIDETSKYELLNELEDYIPSNWNIFAHHMTIKFGGPIPKELEKYLGEEVKLTATHIGISDMAIAVKVEGFKSYNDIPHITIAVNPDGGKPVMSNNIKNWKEINNIELSGTVEEK